MTLNYDKTIKVMASAFQEAALKPVTWVDAKRGMEAAFEALQKGMQERESAEDFTFELKETSRIYNQLKNLKRENYES